MTNLKLACSLMLLTAGLSAQAQFEGADQWNSLFAKSATWQQESNFGRRIELAGRALIGTPYVGGTLEQNPKKESCFVTLKGLDCVTFVESAIGLAKIAKLPRPTPNALVRAVEELRYRGGMEDGYVSRLHYTSDWMDDNASRGNFMLMASEWTDARKPWAVQVGYMSANPSRYPALAANLSLVPKIKKMEDDINQLEHWYIPKSSVASIVDRLQSGDVIGFCTDKQGLDTSHVGLISVDRNGARRVLHASSSKGQVVLGGDVVSFVNSDPHTTGIVVARPIDR